MQKQQRKRNNSGFTLVELIVVVLIIGIISAVSVISLSTISRAKANGCTDKLTKLLDQTRMDSMSRVDGAVKLVVSKEGNAYYGTIYVDGGTVKEKVELGDGGLEIRFVQDAPSTSVTVDETHSFTIKFKKGNGSLLFDAEAPGAEALSFDRIVITGTNTRTIRVYEETGRYRLQ